MGDENLVPFQWKAGLEPDDKRVHVVASYGTARIHIDFVDDETGGEDLGKVFRAWPAMIKYIREELMIRQSADEVDQDLLDLLGEGDEK